MHCMYWVWSGMSGRVMLRLRRQRCSRRVDRDLAAARIRDRLNNLLDGVEVALEHLAAIGGEDHQQGDRPPLHAREHLVPETVVAGEIDLNRRNILVLEQAGDALVAQHGLLE